MTEMTETETDGLYPTCCIMYHSETLYRTYIEASDRIRYCRLAFKSQILAPHEMNNPGLLYDQVLDGTGITIILHSRLDYSKKQGKYWCRDLAIARLKALLQPFLSSWCDPNTV